MGVSGQLHALAALLPGKKKQGKIFMVLQCNISIAD
jgi:hypothetical protein